MLHVWYRCKNICLEAWLLILVVLVTARTPFSPLGNLLLVVFQVVETLQSGFALNRWTSIAKIIISNYFWMKTQIIAGITWTNNQNQQVLLRILKTRTSNCVASVTSTYGQQSAANRQWLWMFHPNLVHHGLCLILQISGLSQVFGIQNWPTKEGSLWPKDLEGEMAGLVAISDGNPFSLGLCYISTFRKILCTNWSY